ncbi:biotin carboxyl carrier domain-containing protein [Herbaspirillum seropedicae]|uniref:acetyl-CoA carboxylase n=1 Tax=Herbaspirillum seropedicae TaxID=964 RepID=UPI000847F3A9|nr:acetyl-CoA carboxylase [Herbaspirillum seropedicae]AON56457.1 biotin carboxyl carrier protein [Herbaspirillum seropedicae]QDD66364.1 biotin carboxyl carrier domain-containing protein [Herbaspirillum seropedicae]
MAVHEVQSPLPGTFYRRSSPEAPPYAEAGELIEAGRVIGLIEVMKQFTELQAEHGGKLQAFHVGNGDPVEPGQLVAVIETAD